MRLAYTIANRIGYNDDLEGEALLALCSAVENIGERENLVGYIIVRVRGACLDYIERCSTVRVPRRTYVRNLANGTNLKTRAQQHADINGVVRFQDPIEEEELFNAIALKPREKIFLRMVLEGYSDTEVAKRCSVSKKTISLLRKVVEERISRVIRQDSYAERRATLQGDEAKNHDP